MNALQKLIDVLIDAEVLGLADFEKAGMGVEDLRELDAIGDGKITPEPKAAKVLYGDGFANMVMGQRVYKIYANRTVELYVFGDDETVHLSVPNCIRRATWARYLTKSIPLLHQAKVLDNEGFNLTLMSYFFKYVNVNVLAQVALSQGIDLEISAE